MKTYYRKPPFFSLYAQLVLCIFFSFANAVAIAQTKPAAAKPAAAKPKSTTTGAAKQSSAATRQKPVAKPAAKPTTQPTSGQTVKSQPAPVKSQTSTTQPAAGSPQKTATAPAGTYNAGQNKTTPPPAPRAKLRTYAFNEGDKLLNVGVGLSSYYYGNPIGASFEWAVHKDISVGMQLDYNSGRYNDYYYSSSHWGYRAYYLGARGSYHFNRLLKLSSKIDLYAGVGLGYQSFRWNDRSYGYGYDYRSGLFPNYFVGGKYYFTPKFGLFAELGYTGLSSSRVGVTFKF